MSDTHYNPRPLRSGSGNSINNSVSSLQEAISSSSLSRLNLNANGSEIQHTDQVLEQISGLLCSENSSDVTLVVGGHHFPAHRVILGARSEYFRAMLYGGMRESNENEITLKDTPVEAFKVLLKYIYTGKLQIQSMSFDLVLDFLGLVHRYCFTELEHAVPEYLKSIINNRNVFAIYATSFLYSINNLLMCCLDYIDNCANDILANKGFLQLSALSFAQIIERDSFCVPEVEIFKLVHRWIDAHPDEKTSHQIVLGKIRLSLISLTDLLGTVRASGLLTPDQLLDAISDQNVKKSSDLCCRGFLFPNVNVATITLNAKVITGDYKGLLLANSVSASLADQNLSAGAPSSSHHINGIPAFGADLFGTIHSVGDEHHPPTPAHHLIAPYSAYDGGHKRYTCHPIGAFSKENGIVIELGRPFIINNIRISLLDRDQRSYSYFIEVSVDMNDWVRVIDHTTYYCRGRQNLFFEKRVVKYIRLVGTQCTLPVPFQLAALEAMFNTDPFKVDPVTTLRIPSENVATIPNGATVIEGVSRSRNALLNGDTTNYDWDNGYTCHELGSSSITIQLPQPYLLSSMRLLLWDCDERLYSFYVEVSCDQSKWFKVAEKEHCRSWQSITFEQIPVVFVRIFGTYNSANEVFHCVHFECPNQDKPNKKNDPIAAKLSSKKKIETDRVKVQEVPKTGLVSPPHPCIQTKLDGDSSKQKTRIAKHIDFLSVLDREESALNNGRPSSSLVGGIHLIDESLLFGSRNYDPSECLHGSFRQLIDNNCREIHDNLISICGVDNTETPSDEVVVPRFDLSDQNDDDDNNTSSSSESFSDVSTVNCLSSSPASKL